MSRPAPSRTIAIVPVKRFGTAKSRLSPALAVGERERLATAMLHDTLEVLGQVPGIARTLVVTGDPQAAAIARNYGAAVVADTQEAGTNAAMVQGLAAAEGLEQSVIMLPADLPGLAPATIEQAIAGLATAEVVIAAAADGGTALLALRRNASMKTAFGPGSFERHLNAARQAHLAVTILEPAQPIRDLDTVEDMVVLGKDLSHGRTRQLLRALR